MIKNAVGTVNIESLPDRPYLLLTPGPLSTTKSVKAAMLQDWCTWDRDYSVLVQDIRSRLAKLASSRRPEAFAIVPMQGSGTFGVEAALGTAIPREGGKLAVLANGAYGDRIAEIARVAGIPCATLSFGETTPVDPDRLRELLESDPAITHVAVVHGETTTGMLNPIAETASVARAYGKTVIVDAMSTFGGIPLDMEELGIDYLISSSNKCIQGVPGFSFVAARVEKLALCEGNARSLSLDLYDQWSVMERQAGKWRFTSPTHAVRAFSQALTELEEEGGVEARYRRYSNNQRALSEGMARLGFRPLLPTDVQSPIITAFEYPEEAQFSFAMLYEALKQDGFVIYPGKISSADTFRIGSIGDVYPADMARLIQGVERFLKNEGSGRR